MDFTSSPVMSIYLSLTVASGNTSLSIANAFPCSSEAEHYGAAMARIGANAGQKVPDEEADGKNLRTKLILSLEMWQ